MGIILGVTATFFVVLFGIWSDNTTLDQRIRTLLFFVAALNSVGAYQFVREGGNLSFSAMVTAITALICVRLFTFWKNEDPLNIALRWGFFASGVIHSICAFHLFGLI
jgi:hypothetical protein